MKKTRNMIILVGASSLINEVLPELQFKGSVIVKDPINYDSVTTIFNNNKSIICSSEIAEFERYHENPIYIEISDGPSFVYQNHINVNSGNITKQFQDIVDKHNLDIGDHKSNSSGLNGVPTVSDCSYCKEFKHEVVDIPHAILYKSKHFYVLATLGEFITGYLLIIPERHVMSMAELTAEERSEFIDVLADTKFILNLAYGYDNFLVWENGSGNSGKGKAKDSVVHSHVHIAPSNLTPEKITKLSGISLDKICYTDLPNYNLHSYLLVGGKNYNEWFINNNPDVYIPRQFIRQILAEEHGITGEKWNWRVYPFLDLMKQMEDDFYAAVKNNWEKLPERIKKYTKNSLPKD